MRRVEFHIGCQRSGKRTCVQALEGYKGANHGDIARKSFQAKERASTKVLKKPCAWCLRNNKGGQCDQSGVSKGETR